MDVTELEIAIFDAGGFSFGTEVSQIISVVRSSEVIGEHEVRWMGEHKVRPYVEDESISLVDLSTQLGTGGKTPSEDLGHETGDTRKPEGRKAGKPESLKSQDVVLLVDTVAGMTGVHVDSLRGIVKMPLEQIEPLPEFLSSRVQTDCIWGIGKLEQELIILLDIDRYVVDFRF